MSDTGVAPSEASPTDKVLLTKVSLDETPVNRRRGGEIRVLLSPRTTRTSSGFMGMLTLRPGEYVSEHYHPYSEEFLYVSRGTMVVRIDGEQELELAAGEGMVIPKNARHRVMNRGDGEAFAVFHMCPLAPRPELGHVDTEPYPDGSAEVGP
ncbi:cupin domain-containing protein [Nonomuraea sp. M3C6]|uniref:Cupin domain-containing protein n=1 Tax=Nonomuraea marmarensis TaxID=3351344 RepID=A0ABW7AJI6_9ACTN